MARKAPITLPEVNFSKKAPSVTCTWAVNWIQGSMLVDAPTVLVHEYIQRMMAWLLFVDPAHREQAPGIATGLGRRFAHQVLSQGAAHENHRH